jgi:hypothetical protein
MSQRNATSAAKINVAIRRREAIKLRLAGMTFDEIGARLTCSAPYAYRMVSAELERMAAEAHENTAALRELEAARLDAVDRFVRISARRAALLGLDRPTKIAPTSPDGSAPYEGGGLAALLASVAG